MKTLVRTRPATLRRWRTPPPPGPWIAVPAVVVGVVVALLLPAAPRPGVNVPLSALVLALPLIWLLRIEGLRRGKDRPIGYAAGLLVTVGIALPGVAAIRATVWLSAACTLAGLCLVLAVLLDLRRWDAVLAGPGLFVQAVLRSLPWAGRDLLTDGPAVPRPVVTGTAIGAGLVVVVATLLASADPAYARVLAWFAPDAADLPIRVVVLMATSAVFLGGAFAVRSRRSWKPAGRRESRPAAEWLIPLVLVAVTIGTFLAVEAGSLFGGLDVVRPGTDLSHADRARQGFGQLCVVTMLVLALLAWAGSLSSRGTGRDRRWMGLTGGALLALTLLLAGSALRRLWLYQGEYGWTVARVNAGTFECWLVAVLLGAAAAWLLHRADLLPRLVMGSAGLGLLVVSLLGPDALVARADVLRFQQTGKIDLTYLARLSDDAVPALQRLPEAQRSCVLGGRTGLVDPWLGWNHSRARAARLLADRPAIPSYDCG